MEYMRETILTTVALARATRIIANRQAVGN